MQKRTFGCHFIHPHISHQGSKIPPSRTNAGFLYVPCPTVTPLCLNVGSVLKVSLPLGHLISSLTAAFQAYSSIPLTHTMSVSASVRLCGGCLELVGQTPALHLSQAREKMPSLHKPPSLKMFPLSVMEKQVLCLFSLLVSLVSLPSCKLRNRIKLGILRHQFF